MRRLRLLTAGESHGPAMSGVLEGLPAGLRVSTAMVDRDLARRQHGYGSGRRMLIEQDRVVWMGGLRFGRTLGSPLAFRIDNRDWDNWRDKMAVERLPARGRPRAITLARPGHADLAGAIKYDTHDVRDVLERASARSTAPRVLAGAVCRQLLAVVGVRIWSYVEQLGPVRAFPDAEDPLAHVPTDWPAHDLADPSPLRCPDPDAEAAMIARIDEARSAGDTVGGVFEVVVHGAPIGLGSYVHWDRRLDAALAAAVMSINIVKGVELGLGFEQTRRFGSQVHDVIEGRGDDGHWIHRTNNAGGLTGGITNGEPIVVRGAVKPISTLARPLASADLLTGQPVEKAHYERSDISVVPAAGVVGEAMVMLTLASFVVDKFGGDSLEEIRASLERDRERIGRNRSGAAREPADVAAEAGPVGSGGDD